MTTIRILTLALIYFLTTAQCIQYDGIQRKKLQLDSIFHRSLGHEPFKGSQPVARMYKQSIKRESTFYPLHTNNLLTEPLAMSWLQTRKVAKNNDNWSWYKVLKWMVQGDDQAEYIFQSDQDDGKWGDLLPNSTDKVTVLGIAKMAAIAYFLPDSGDWDPVEDFPFNYSFGWKQDGLRGYVFATKEKDFAVVSLKGTSASFLGIGGGDTGTLDKLNDNHMFSCCCARVDRTWSPVCDCHQALGVCNSTCIRNDTRSYKHSYYEAGKDLYQEIQKMYPNATIWFSGHSLGGALSALLGLTFHKPAITFEAPGEYMFASRIGLDIPKDLSTLPIYHFGNNADPIFMGSCRGTRSSCYYAGYALETKCHLGHVCTYKVRDIASKDEDETLLESVVKGVTETLEHVEWWPWPTHNTSVNPTPTISTSTTTTATIPLPTPTHPHLNWRVDIRHHQIWDMIDNVIKQWPSVAPCRVNSKCQDCLGWKFVE